MVTVGRETMALNACFCPTCGEPLSNIKLQDQGIHHCPCGERVARVEEALTIIDEIPLSDYLGG